MQQVHARTQQIQATLAEFILNGCNRQPEVGAIRVRGLVRGVCEARQNRHGPKRHLPDSNNDSKGSEGLEFNEDPSIRGQGDWEEYHVQPHVLPFNSNLHIEEF